MVREVDPHVIDVVLALVLTAVALAIVIGRPGNDNDFRGDDLLGMALVLMQTLPLAMRRVAPLGVLVAISTALVAHSAMGYEVVQAGTFGSLIAVYGAGSLTTAAAAFSPPRSRRSRSRGSLPPTAEIGAPSTLPLQAPPWAMGWLLGTFVRIRGGAGGSRRCARRTA